MSTMKTFITLRSDSLQYTNQETSSRS